MHWPKSEGRRLVDLDLGGEFIKKAYGWKSNTSKHIAPTSKCRFSKKFITEGHEKADELAQEGARLDGEDLAQVRAITIQHERDEVCAGLQYADSFHCLVEE